MLLKLRFSLFAIFFSILTFAQNISQPTDFEVCDDDNDGFASFDLSFKDPEILNGLNPSGYAISYHETIPDADNGTNAIPVFYTNVSNPQTIFVRVEDLNDGTSEITNFDLIVHVSPIPSVNEVVFCEIEEFVDLTSHLPGFEIEGLNISFHLTENEAIFDTNAITNPENFQHNFVQQIFARVEDFSNGCSYVSTMYVNYNINDSICDISCQDITITVITTPEPGENDIITILPEESIDFTADITFSESDENVSYLWDFGDGSNSSELNVTYEYSNPGSYDVTLSVTDSNGFCTEVSESINIQVLGENVVVTEDYSSVEYLVEEVLLGGQCSQVFNITSTSGADFNDVQSIGYFQSASSLFPFSEGILLSTGSALGASGPNSTSSSSGGQAWPGDSDLDALLDINSSNATIIEFDFIPLVNEISFDFLMASEEYNAGTFECEYSDAFAFLLTDAQGITTNLAVLPGTTTPILVTNIHPENDGCIAINEEFFGGYIDENAPPIAYDGRTVSFTASAEVSIGESYHIKMVIADDNDQAFDSGVFLKSSSLDVGELCDDIGLINVKAFIDSNSNELLDADEVDFTNGSFTYEKNNDGIINEVNTSIGNFSIVSENESDQYNISYSVYDELSDCYSVVSL